MERERKGGFGKIDDGKTYLKKCNHPEHDPPGFIVLQPGTYEYTCPGCGAVRIVGVPPHPSLNANFTSNGRLHISNSKFTYSHIPAVSC